jgi:hypothetical protein
MLSTQDFIRLFSLEHNLIKMQTNDLTQADTLLQPDPSGNCMNWVLGHLLDNQIALLELLGASSPVDPTQLALYQTESSPITAEGPGVLPLERLLEYHDTVQERLVARLVEMSDADFAREVQFRDRTTTLGWRLFFLQFHYTYHIGQLELLRQMAGKMEKLI